MLAVALPSFAVSQQEAFIIYKTIAAKNGLNPPPLVIGYFRNREGKIVKKPNAQYRGIDIIVNPPMLASTNKDELALVLGHELGHWKYDHRGSTHQREYIADQQGAIYSKRAGYSVCRGKQILLKFKQQTSKTHPHPRDRYNRIPC